MIPAEEAEAQSAIESVCVVACEIGRCWREDGLGG